MRACTGILSNRMLQPTQPARRAVGASCGGREAEPPEVLSEHVVRHTAAVVFDLYDKGVGALNFLDEEMNPDPSCLSVDCVRDCFPQEFEWITKVVRDFPELCFE